MGGNGEEARVWVYQYMCWDDATQGHKVSNRYFTLELIKSGLGIALFTTGMLVDPADVIDGVYIANERGAKAAHRATDDKAQLKG